ncbi:G patch domain-containing protein 4 [Tiliqua scincoides]|uniref:G patch domain-containing protein 4 n=1 Tax=Tiliqua scincoides TaxID=71010 RepID=UPI0034634FAA
MRFAERELRRRGWRAGKGLGKREDGIAEALKVKVKCDTAGVGHSSAEELTFHWWDHVYNSVATNINVEAGQDGAKVTKISKQSRAITNKKPRKAHEKNMLYGRFVKAATLTAGTEEPLMPPPSSDSSDEDEKLDLSTARRLTDEELVQVCGGRTAHKGARHGLKMSAKLARLEAQEKAFLASRVQPTGQEVTPSSSCQEERRKKGRKQRKRQERELEGLEDQEEAEGPRKKKKKKRKQRHEDGGGE